MPNPDEIESEGEALANALGKSGACTVREQAVDLAYAACGSRDEFVAVAPRRTHPVEGEGKCVTSNAHLLCCPRCPTVSDTNVNPVPAGTATAFQLV
jgi:hypothetical protein